MYEMSYYFNYVTCCRCGRPEMFKLEEPDIDALPAGWQHTPSGELCDRCVLNRERSESVDEFIHRRLWEMLHAKGKPS